MDIYKLNDLITETRESGTAFHEFLRVDPLSCGMYVLPAGGVDDQTPHHEDEIYVVHRGRGKFVVAGRQHDVGPGDVIFVAAEDEHRFFDITEDLELLVVFAPAYSGRRTGPDG
jgi:mannose-6-phosphate isomerase-like protein (cupin superfamily)